MLLRIFAVGALCAVATGCTVYGRAATPAARVDVVEYEYQPMYYGNDVVYYDDGGMPYVYVGGGVRYVPRTDARFRVFVDHHHKHRTAYRKWHGTHARGKVHVRGRVDVDHDRGRRDRGRHNRHR